MRFPFNFVAGESQLPNETLYHGFRNQNSCSNDLWAEILELKSLDATLLFFQINLDSSSGLVHKLVYHSRPGINSEILNQDSILSDNKKW